MKKLGEALPAKVAEALAAAPRLGAVAALQKPAWWAAIGQANPGVDLAAQVLKAEAYLVAHPEKHYTKLGPFLHGWIGRAERGLGAQPAVPVMETHAPAKLPTYPTPTPEDDAAARAALAALKAQAWWSATRRSAPQAPSAPHAASQQSAERVGAIVSRLGLPPIHPAIRADPSVGLRRANGGA